MPILGTQDSAAEKSLSTQVHFSEVPAAYRPLPVGGDHPVVVYIARLGAGSRRCMEQALDNCARLLSPRARGWREVDWTVLRYSHVQALRSELAGRYEPTTTNRHLSALKGVAREAWRLGQLEHEELAKILDIGRVRPSGKLAGREVRGEELARLFASLRDSPGGARDEALLGILCGGGLRRAEAASRLLEDYRPAEEILRVVGKGGKFREVHLSDEMRAAFDRWLRFRGPDAGPLFCPVHRSGAVQRRAMTPEAIKRALERLAKLAGVDHFTPHDLRRTYASHQLDAGTDIATVASLMGHANINTTARYDRRGDAAKKAAARAVHIPFREGAR